MVQEKFIVVATEDELQIPFAASILAGRLRTPIVTGVGATNVINALKDLPRDSDILNVGYCGSNRFPVGSAVWIGETRLFHPNVNFQEITFELGPHDTICLTSGDFVLDGSDLPTKSVVDMELAHIAAFGFAHLSSLKIVSDNLSVKQYNERAKLNPQQ